MKPKFDIKNHPWLVVAFLFFATTINYIDRQVIGILKPYISEDLGWSEAEFGYMVSSFQLAYAIGLLFAGGLIDRFGTKRGYTLAIGLWSIAATLHGTARNLFHFCAARFFLGLGESGNFPAAIKTVAEWFPPQRRALVTGLFNSGSNIGAITAPLIVSVITLSLGWEWAFYITGFLGIIWLLFWILLYQNPGNKIKPVSKAQSDLNTDSKLSWKLILFRKQTIGICITRLMTDWVWWFFLFWTPAYLNKAHHVNLSGVVLPLVIIYSISGVGSITGGWLSSGFLRAGKTVDFARKTTILLYSFLAFPVVFIPYIQNLWICVLLISLAAAAHCAYAANIFTIVSDIYPSGHVGKIVGISGFVGAIGGTLSATVVGLILQYTGSYTLIFTAAGVSYFMVWVVLKILVPKIEIIQ